MRPETQSKLDEIFEQRERQDVAAARAKSDQEQSEEAALAKFKSLRENVIKPTMQSFAYYLASKGHNANIVENEERFEGGPANGRLGKRLQLSCGSLPMVQINMHSSRKVLISWCVWIRRNPKFGFMKAQRGDNAGPCGELSLDGLNEQMLEEAITKTIGNIFN